MNISTIIPIAIFVVVSVIVISIIFILSKRNKPATEIKLMPINHPNDDIKVKKIEEKENKEPMVEEVKQEVKEEVKPQEEIKTEEVKEEKVQTPLIDIPINQMDDTPIEIEEAKSLVENNTEEMIKIEGSTPIEEPKKEEVVVEEAPIANNEIIETSIVNNTIIEPVKTENEITEVKMIDSAFNQSPDDNRDINTNIKVEDTREYVGNKTEILNTEEIKRSIANKE